MALSISSSAVLTMAVTIPLGNGAGQFAPAGPAESVGSLTVTSDAKNGPSLVALSGSGS